MDEQRITAYLNLIQSLLNCPNREELSLLQANAELVDEGLVQVIQAIKLLLSVLPAIAIDNTPQSIYPLLQTHLDNLDNNLPQILTVCAKEIFAKLEPETAELIATVILSFSNLMQKFPLGNITSNQELAIAGYQTVAPIFTESDFPQHWAGLQNNLANAYKKRIWGDRADNLERAIAHCYNALLLLTQADFPYNRAMIQNNLGDAYLNRIRGDRADNLEIAITHYHNALLVYTQSDFPQDWAMTQDNLAMAYSEKIQGDKAENIERAIAHCYNALLVRTHSDFPQDWAGTQNNLANAYSERIREDRAENLEIAITHYHNALLVYTQSDFPQDWAGIQNNLALAYFDRIWGNKAENIERAIAHYHNALLVYTPSNFPIYCFRTSKNLGNLAWDTHDFTLAIKSYNLAIKAVEQSRDWVIDEERRQEILADSIYVYERIIQAYLNIGEIGKALEYTERFRCQRLVELMASDNPLLAEKIQVDHLNLDQVQELIQDDTTALLSFYTTVEDTHIFILLKHKNPQVYTCKGQGIETFQQWIAKNWFIPYIGANAEWRENMESFLQELAQRLQLKDLISQHLTGIEELIIVPHLRLHQMPFAALPIDGMETFHQTAENSKPLSLQERGFLAPAKSKGDAETRGLVIGKKSQPKVTLTPTTYLGDLFRIRIVPSCQILYYCHQRPPIANQPTMGIVEDATEDLLFTRYECETLAQSYGVSADKRLQGRKATVTEYKTLASQVQILHSSHHATSNPMQPLNSYLVLGDGSLTLSQLISPGWRMPNLSDVFACCCEVNFSVNKVTDDLLSLATGFLCAGARSVVSTQWSVEDLASALLAIFYYNFRQAGMSRSQALQQGQIKLRNLTGEEFARNYQGEIGKYLQRQYDEAIATRDDAKAKGDDEEYPKWQELADKIQVQQQRLQSLGNQDLPFSHPYYWAGFVSQGLA